MTTFSLSDTKTSHVAVLAFPFSSHAFSTHTLVLRLARSSPNTHFTFLSIPGVNASLFRSSPPIPNFTPHDLDDGVPAGQSASEHSFEKKMELFEKVLLRPGSMKNELDKAVAAAGGAKITCLLVDAVLSFVMPDVAEELCVPWIALWTSASLLLSSYVHFHAIRQHCASATTGGSTVDVALDFIPGLEGVRVSDHLEAAHIFHGDLDERPGFRQTPPRFEQALRRASAVVLNSFHELNPIELNRDLESKFQAFLNIGFFTLSFPLQQSLDEDLTGCLAWLDSQKPNSVAYIGFGTSAIFSEEELKIMAEALEETEISFLWSLPSEQQRLLPSGFAERMQQSGRLVAWTDQRRVLAHGSVGVNVTHCGTNSVNESVAYGIPIIYGKALTGDNQMHALVVERDWGMGVRVSETGVLTKHGFVRALEMVLKQEEGKKIKERALVMQRIAMEASSPGGSGARDLDALLGLLSAV